MQAHPSSHRQEGEVEFRSRSLKSMTERQDLLAQAIASEVAASGARVESQTGAMAVMVHGRPVNHVLYFLLGFVTVGIGWLVWALAVMFGGERRLIVQVDEYGNILSRKGRRAP
jgi:hypothetical protein